MVFGFRKQKNIDELQEEDEKVELQYSIAQKQAAIEKLKQAGLTTRDFGSWREIFKWLKSH